MDAAGDVLGWNGDLTYRAGVTYTGLPYGQPVNAAYVPWVTDLDGFAAAVKDPNSSMYTSYSTYNCRAPYYSCDCSAFVSWAWGLGGRQTTRTIANYATEISTTSYENAQVGDCFCLAGTHVVLITALTYDSNHKINGMEISESTVNAATNYCCQKTWYGDGHTYPLSKVQSKYLDNGYILYRSNTRDSVTYTHACSVPLAGDVCAQCGYGLQLQTVAVTLRTRADTNLYAQPDAAEPVGTVYQGVDIQVGTCARTGSGVWCKTGDGQWLKATDVDFVSYDKTVSVTDKAFPNGALPAGSAFALKGTVRSVNPMTEICAAVYPAQEDSEPVLEKRIVLDRADSYALAGSELDSALPFQTLAAGDYRFVLTVTELASYPGREDAALVTTEESAFRVGEAAPCSHTHTKTEEQAATCTEDGLRTVTCLDCGAVTQETLPAKGHTYQNGVCTVCGETEYLLGGLNGDGLVTSADAVLLSRSLTDLAELTAEQQKAADINGDGVITSADAVILVRFLAELIPSLR
ncbi:MAG: dockerin type I repeat-containing protein [Oscillospiraceae bacterium]